MKREEVKKFLENPGNDYRGCPFWCWNGKLEEKELLRQIDVMKDMGFGGFFMHSRTGLKTEYMGEEWFDLVRKCTEYGKKVGMDAWLYDEDRWPSGTCGGLVAKNPDFRMRFISEYDSDEEALACEDVVKILERYAVKLNKDNKLVDCYKVDDKSEVKDGYNYYVYAEELMHSNDFYNGYAYIDTMNKDAVKEFIKMTHEEYKKHCGDLLGNSLKGIFTDEPHRGALFIGFGIDNINKSRMTSYTGNLKKAYKDKYNEELLFPELYYTRENEDINRTSYQYIDVLDDLFIEGYAVPYEKWCNENNIIATGHILHEDSLSIQASLSGSMMRYYEHMGYPGIDCLGEFNPPYWIVKQCSSVAHQLGKKRVLSELYGCTGWQMTFESYKHIGDWQALSGITFRCPHLSWYTMGGEAKRDFPASIFYQNAWYKDWKVLEDYYSRIGKIMTDGKPLTEVLVINPVESMWGYVRRDWMEFFTPKDKRISDLDKAYIDQYYELISNHIDFDYGDEELMAKHGKVIIENGVAYLQVGNAKYSQVLKQNLIIKRESTEKLLADFIDKGGKVVDKVTDLKPLTFKAPEKVLMNYREYNGDIFVFMLNLDVDNKIEKSKIIVPECYRNMNAEEWDLMRNKSLGKTDLNFAFDKGEMKLIRLTYDDVSDSKVVAYEKAQLPEEMDYQLTEENVLVIDRAKFTIDGKLRNNGLAMDVLKIDRAVRDYMGLKRRGGSMVQPWFNEKYCKKTKEKIENVSLDFTFWSDIETEVKLSTEKVDEIIFNGKKITEKTDEFWIDTCFDVYKLGKVIKGENHIVFKYKFKETTDIEAIYLLGNFGVKLPATIINLPKKLTTGNITEQGLPFYSGSIIYKTGLKKGVKEISFNKIGATIIKIHGGKEEDFIAFEPYTAVVEADDEITLEAVFTRRNTFGPFHIRPYPQGMYSPDSFLTEGLNWSDNYLVEKQGLEIK